MKIIENENYLNEFKNSEESLYLMDNDIYMLIIQKKTIKTFQ